MTLACFRDAERLIIYLQVIAVGFKQTAIQINKQKIGFLLIFLNVITNKNKNNEKRVLWWKSGQGNNYFSNQHTSALSFRMLDLGMVLMAFGEEVLNNCKMFFFKFKLEGKANILKLKIWRKVQNGHRCTLFKLKDNTKSSKCQFRRTLQNDSWPLMFDNNSWRKHSKYLLSKFFWHLARLSKNVN